MLFIPRATMLAVALMVSSPLFAAGLQNPTLEEQQVLAKAQENAAQASPQKRAFIDQQLRLSPEQATQFWPVYEEHQVRLGELNRRRIENILIYARALNAGSVDDKTANALAREAIAIEEDEVSLLKRSYQHASRALSPAQAALYVQIEGKGRDMLRAREAMQVPLVK
jgi:Spy/CpxP family protein refolding chaperone